MFVKGEEAGEEEGEDQNGEVDVEDGAGIGETHCGWRLSLFRR